MLLLPYSVIVIVLGLAPQDYTNNRAVGAGPAGAAAAGPKFGQKYGGLHGAKRMTQSWSAMSYVVTSKFSFSTSLYGSLFAVHS